MSESKYCEPWSIHPATGFAMQTDEHGYQDRIVACVNACAGIPTADLPNLAAENKRLRKLLSETDMYLDLDGAMLTKGCLGHLQIKQALAKGGA